MRDSPSQSLHDFLDFKRLPQTALPDQFHIQKTPLGVQRVKAYDLWVGDKFLIFGPDRNLVVHYVVNRCWQAASGLRRRIEFENAIFGWPLRLTDWQLSWPEKEDRIRPNFPPSDGQPDLHSKALHRPRLRSIMQL